MCGDRSGGNKLVYGIWGDTNGGTDTGEASISLAEMCFPSEDITGNSGHDPNDVLYIGFTGTLEGGAETYDWLVFAAIVLRKMALLYLTLF
jgi:chitosanase